MNIEQVLLAKAQQDEQDKLTTGQSAGVGAGIGMLAGVIGSDGQMDQEMMRRRMQGQSSPGRGIVKRMAGGLTGAILGGVLGAGTREILLKESPAARMLAKLQTGDISPADQQALQNILADTYSSTIGM